MITSPQPHPPSVEVLANGARAVIGALHRGCGSEEQRVERFIIDFVAVNMAGKSLWDMWEVRIIGFSSLVYLFKISLPMCNFSPWTINYIYKFSNHPSKLKISQTLVKKAFNLNVWF